MSVAESSPVSRAELAVVPAHLIFQHAYASCEQFRAEFHVLLCFVRAALLNAAFRRHLLFEYRRGQVFELFLPMMLEWLDAESLVACESVCRSWHHECRRFEESNWEQLCFIQFQVSTKAFRRRSRSMGSDEKDADETFSAKDLYKMSWQKMRMVLRGGGAQKVLPTSAFVLR